MRWHNPIAFTPLPVTIVSSGVYFALIVSLLVVHHVVPPARDIAGINLTEAWLDLQTLSNGYHPYNSRRNDDVRDWLLGRIEAVVEANGALISSIDSSDISKLSDSAPVTIFSDTISNVSFSSNVKVPSEKPGTSVYFEGTNIIVYIRGSEDDQNDWWLNGTTFEGKGGVLVNAHYDSVSTGFGATDDGVGVVTIVQLIKYFSARGRQPRKGIVALLNNGEEDFLNGARAFSQHPIAKFPRTFLNLEGAGAGGRATLFRSTDTEVTKFYQKNRYPFGSVLSADAFKRRIIRSETDYSIFYGGMGMRGLDVAFLEPRARYHTDEDDTKHTNKDSVHHMLSAALSAMQGLTADTSSIFEGEASGKGRAPSGKGTDGVWFDLFGATFAVFQLNVLFALSVTLLVVAPMTLIIIGAVLYKVDRFYMFSASKHQRHADGDDTVSLGGWRGFSRWPIAFILSSAGVIGLAFLVTKVNPYIVYSSPYAVWSMIISAWVFIAWVCTSVANYVRPTAFQRIYTMLWMFIAGWLVIIAATVLERKEKIAGGYFVVFYFACIFVATSIAFLELFGLPRKSDFAAETGEQGEERPDHARAESMSSARPLAEEQPENTDEYAVDEGEEANETTSLLRSGGRRTTFKHYSSPHQRTNNAQTDDPAQTHQSQVYDVEQSWSHSLPSILWLLEFLFLAPIPLIIIGQIALLLTSATYQTLCDGNAPITLYLAIAILTILLFTPLGPFLHRYTYHIPMFLFLVFAGSLIYNLIAFPFSPNNRLKLYFLQTVDLDTGINTVSLTGIGDPPYLLNAIHSLPSSAGAKVSCVPSKIRPDLTECSWIGLAPRVVRDFPHPAGGPELGYRDWVSLNISRSPNHLPEASFRISGQGTRACKILFNTPISDFHVANASQDDDSKNISEHGSKELRLWSRTWDREWDVSVKWEGEGGKGLDGRVVCLWSDDNELGVIPALDEVRRFSPGWIGVSKSSDGLVEGIKAFAV